MPYDAIKGYIPESFNDIMDIYRNKTNSVFSVNYDEQNFLGTAFFKDLLPATERGREVELLIERIVQKIKEENQKINDLNLITNNYSRIFLKLKEEGLVNDVSFKEPVNLDDAGTFGISLEYIEEEDKNDVNLNSKIANVLANEIGTSNLTIDFTGQGFPVNNYKFNGINEVTGQVLPFYWVDDEKVDISLQLIYKKNEGFALPSQNEIKQTLLNNLASYRFGSQFTPQLFISCSFPYFREKNLLWSINSSPFSEEEFTPLFFKNLIFKEENILLIQA